MPRPGTPPIDSRHVRALIPADLEERDVARLRGGDDVREARVCMIRHRHPDGVGSRVVRIGHDVPVGEHVAVRADHKPRPAVVLATERDRDQAYGTLVSLRHAREIGAADGAQFGLNAGGLLLRGRDGVSQAVNEPRRRSPALGRRQFVA